MTRYELVRTVNGTEERHPAQPANGFQWASEANLWAISAELGGDWFVRPVPADAQPARLGGTL